MASTSKPVGLLRVVVVHQDPATRDLLREELGGGGYIDPVFVDDVGQAADVVEAPGSAVAAVLFPWKQPVGADAVKACVGRMRAGKAGHTTYVLPYDGSWSAEDVRAACAAEVHSFLAWPLDHKAVLTELFSLKKLDRGPTRVRLLSALMRAPNARSLLEMGGPESKAVTKSADLWRARMFQLSRARSGSKPPGEDPRVRKLYEVLNDALGHEVSLSTVEALTMVARQDQGQIDQLTGGDPRELKTLLQLYELAEHTCSRDGRGRLAAMMTENTLGGLTAWLHELHGNQMRSGMLERVARYAIMVIGERAWEVRGSETLAHFRVSLGEWLGIDPSSLLEIGGQTTEKIARRLAREQSERRAQTYARLMLLGWLLRHVRNGEAIDLDAISALLGARDGEAASQWIAEALTELEGEDGLPDLLEFASLFADLNASGEAGALDGVLAGLGASLLTDLREAEDRERRAELLARLDAAKGQDVLLLSEMLRQMEADGDEELASEFREHFGLPSGRASASDIRALTRGGDVRAAFLACSELGEPKTPAALTAYREVTTALREAGHTVAAGRLESQTEAAGATTRDRLLDHARRARDLGADGQAARMLRRVLDIYPNHDEALALLAEIEGSALSA